jgi:hypothetical protein
MRCHAAFPLTLSLSLGEREEVASAPLRSMGSRLVPTPPEVLPLLGERAGVRGKVTAD